MRRLHVDILDLHTVSTLGNRYFIGFVCSFSKFVIGFATSNMTAETCAKLFMEGVVLRFGAPEKLISDQGRQFVADLNREVCKLAMCDKYETSKYHPASNEAEADD